jgi:hypothetical protein
MPDYRQNTKEIKSWYRATKVTINNPYGATPTIRLDEEEATDNEGVVTTVPVGFIGAEFDPAERFNLLNPDTGEVIGTVTQLDLYVILHSLYIDLAKKRDLS